MPPVNDLRANAIVVSGNTGSVSGTTVDCVADTTGVDLPSTSVYFGWNTVWYYFADLPEGIISFRLDTTDAVYAEFGMYAENHLVAANDNTNFWGYVSTSTGDPYEYDRFHHPGGELTLVVATFPPDETDFTLSWEYAPKLDLTPVSSAMVYEVHNGPNQTNADFSLALVSSSLAIVFYEVRNNSTPNYELRIQALDPATGSVYYDDQVWTNSTYTLRTVYSCRVSSTEAFAVINTSSSSGTIILVKADASGWTSNSYTGVGTPGFAIPQADGTAGTAYFYLDSGPAIWTVDLSTLVRTATSVTFPTTPTDISGLRFSSIAWRGGIIVGGRGGATTGTNGHFYWYKIGTGWVDYTVPSQTDGAYFTSGGVATGRYLYGKLAVAGPDIEANWAYDEFNDSFALNDSWGYRPEEDGDAVSPDTLSNAAFHRIQPEFPRHLVQGGERRDNVYDDTGMQNPYKGFVHITSANGGYTNNWDRYEFDVPADFAPDYVDFNSFLNFQFVDADAADGWFAGLMYAEAGEFDGVSTTVWHTVVYLVAGRLSPETAVYGWTFGRLGGGNSTVRTW